jgi:diguanylate cyclase (GGDEF)-like protein
MSQEKGRPGADRRGLLWLRERADDDAEASAASDVDQTLAEQEQTLADSDQTAADSDRVGAESDQRLAEQDQEASDRDQAASDREHPYTGGNGAQERSRADREATTRERSVTAETRAHTAFERGHVAARRDEIARVRDLTALARDRAAAERDRIAEARDRAAAARAQDAIESGHPSDALVDLLATLSSHRTSGASVRRQAAADRVAAATDRERAAADRAQAAIDRRYAGLDELTGVFRRGTGSAQLRHEIDRARRSDHPLSLAMIDVDGLKRVNDVHGHAAGDVLLQDTAEAITSGLRSYDVTVRWGGDEFVCALPGISLKDAERRLVEIGHDLGTRHPGASFTTGLAGLSAEDDLESLTGRADAALYEARRDGRPLA